MITSLMYALEAKESFTSSQQTNFRIISDGGISQVGHIVKALTIADMVMCGGMFAGTDEAPGDTIIVDGTKYKRYDRKFHLQS